MAANKLGPGALVSKSELARLFGRPLFTVNEWIRRGLPVAQEGGTGKAYKISTAQAQQWLEERAAELASAKKASGATLDEARRRKTAAEAQLAEYDLAEKRRDMVTVETMAEAMTEDYLRVRARLAQIAPKVAPFLSTLTTPEECQDVVAEAITEALTELATWEGPDDDLDDDLDSTGGDTAPARDPSEGSGEGSAPAAPAPRKRVGRRAPAPKP